MSSKVLQKNKNRLLHSLFLTGLILAVTLGILSPIQKTNAQTTTPEPTGTCFYYGIGSATSGTPSLVETGVKQKDCGGKPLLVGKWTADPTSSSVDDKTALREAVGEKTCQPFTVSGWQGCLVFVSYYLFFALPAFILTIVANLFNALLGTTINGTLYGSSSFIGEAWKVVRDLSNIFFIIILLYAAIEMILGIGHGGKKVIGSVIVMALLINFSMFFTKVVIDSSNILALVFYNKIIVKDSPSNPYKPVMGEKKDIGGAIAGAFNPSKLMSKELFEQKATINGVDVPLKESTSILLGLIFVSCAIFLVASYAFFISGLSFLGRMIELWILLIFSPFAFMSFALPKLASVDGIGWASWSKRLIKAAFMAPIFMFFLYLISKIIQKPVLDGLTPGTNLLSALLLIVIPAMIQIILLLKATEYAKKGSGQLGEIAIGAGKALTTLAIGGGAMVGAAVGRNTVGATAKYVQNEGSRKKALDVKGRVGEAWALKGINKINPLAIGGAVAKTVGAVKNATLAGTAQTLYSVPVGGGKTLGVKLKEADESASHKAHAENLLNEKAKTKFHASSFGELTEPEKNQIKEDIDKDALAKYRFNKIYDKLSKEEALIIDKSYDQKEKIVVDEHGKVKGYGKDLENVQDLNGNRVTDIHGPIFNGDYQVKTAEANAALGAFSQALRKGTFDARNLPEVSTKVKGASKLFVGATAMGASIIRQQIKTVTGVKDFGKPQKDFIKDLKTTITDSLKNVKIDASAIVNAGGGGGHDDHGGGHDDHGGGGHH